MHRYRTIVIVAVIIIVGTGVYLWMGSLQKKGDQGACESKGGTYDVVTDGCSFKMATSTLSALVNVQTPVANSTVASPLTITGTATGLWYFEAVFPIELTDSKGNILAQGQAHSLSDWTTDAQVPFSASLTFAPQAKGMKGTLILKKDNPSGIPANDKSVEIPVTF